MPEVIKALFVGIFEISNGINKAANLNIALNYKICLVSFILSFSSFMILMQIYSFVSKAHVKLKDIVKYKLLQGVLSSIITYITVTYIYTPVSTVNANFDMININVPLLPSTVYMFSLVVIICLSFVLFGKKRQG